MKNLVLAVILATVATPAFADSMQDQQNRDAAAYAAYMHQPTPYAAPEPYQPPVQQPQTSSNDIYHNNAGEDGAMEDLFGRQVGQR